MKRKLAQRSERVKSLDMHPRSHDDPSKFVFGNSLHLELPSRDSSLEELTLHRIKGEIFAVVPAIATTRSEYPPWHASHFSEENYKQFLAQQNPLLQQFNSQSSTVLPQGGLAGAQGLDTVTFAQPPPTLIHLLSGQHTLMSTGFKDAEIGNAKLDEKERHQSIYDDLAKP